MGSFTSKAEGSDAASTSADAAPTSPDAAPIPKDEQQETRKPAPQDSANCSTTASDVDEGNSSETMLPIEFSLIALEAEIKEVRENPPEYVSWVGQLKVPTMVLQDDVMVEQSGEGPWDFSVVVCGSAEKEAYDFPFKLCIRFDKGWPSTPPKVRFRGVFHHALVDDHGGMVLPFYKTLPTVKGIHTLRIVLQGVHDFLVDPLKAWQISPSSAPSRLKQAMVSNESMNSSRLSTIKKYRKMARHPMLFESPAQLREEWFDAAFWKAQQENTPESWRSILTEHLPSEVFSFRIFTMDFCQILLDEIFNFYASGLPARRPNSMNNYGIILNEIGLEPLIDALQGILQPLGDLLWPGAGSEWDGHHCFIVRYREGEDLGLDMHTDDSDVTFNMCLGLEFKGAGLQFCGIMGESNHRRHTHTYQHEKGTVVCHLGRKRHGADDISSGERLNLILWNHSSTYRQSDDYQNPPYTKEEGPPDALCVSYTHDRDYGNFKEYPKGKEHFQGRGWCPPGPFAYEGFKPDSTKEILGG